MKERYIFDKTRMEFRKATMTAWSVLGKLVKYFLVTASLAVVYYAIFSAVVSTDSERRLRAQNQRYRQLYDSMVAREQLLGDVLASLSEKDNAISRQLFNSDAPEVGQGTGAGFISTIDSIPDRDIVAYVSARIRAAAAAGRRVEENLQAVASLIGTQAPLPPLSSPLEDFAYPRTGASVGVKLNPFLKVGVQHDGLDLIAQRGDPVLSAAPGVVEEVIHDSKGLGNVVQIRHGNGYVSRYGHLENTRVYRGQKVSLGTQLGQVGVSGNSFAPHLHYEILRDTVRLDPVHYFFGSVTPDAYMGMVFMSANTGQSMD